MLITSSKINIFFKQKFSLILLIKQKNCYQYYDFTIMHVQRNFFIEKYP